MKIEKLHRNTWNKSGTKYREEMIFEKLEEIIDQLEKQEQLNKLRDLTVKIKKLMDEK